MKKLFIFSLILLFSKNVISQSDRTIYIVNETGLSGEVVVLVPSIAQHNGAPDVKPYMQYNRYPIDKGTDRQEITIKSRARRKRFTDNTYQQENDQWANRFYVEVCKNSKIIPRSVSSTVATDPLDNEKGSLFDVFDCDEELRVKSGKILIRPNETFYVKQDGDKLAVRTKREMSQKNLKS